MHKKQIALNSLDIISTALNQLAKTYKIDSDLLELVFDELTESHKLEPTDIISRLTLILKSFPQSLIQEQLVDLYSLVKIILQPQYSYLKVLSETPNCPFSYQDLFKIFSYIRQSDDLTSPSDLTIERTLQEIKWWITELGLPSDYFERYSLETIANHILLNRLYEIDAKKSNDPIGTFITSHNKGETLYIGSKTSADKIEQLISETHKDKECYVSVFKTKAKDVILYIVKDKSPLNNPGSPSTTDEKFTDEISSRYSSILASQKKSLTPIIEVTQKPETSETRLMVAFPASSYLAFKHLEDILSKHGLPINRKYFHNLTAQGQCIYTLYIPNSNHEELQTKMAEVTRDINNLIICPPNKFTELLDKGFSTDQVLVSNAIAHFVHFFSTKDHPENAEPRNKAASALQQKLDNSEFPLDLIMNTLIKYPEITKALQDIFMSKFDPKKENVNTADLEKMLDDFINDEANVNVLENERLIFKFAKLFLNNINSTNFFMKEKSAISFRMNPAFLNECRYDEKPFGVFFVLGRDFQGFHTRFKDIARGGIRLVISRNLEAYNKNLDDAYREGFGLASAQQKKNKDIPEGGAKGIILARYGITKDAATTAFKQYIDSMLDLMLPTNANDIKNYNEEILFFGPDENTADLMDWACEKARDRGYKFWKSVTTGKAPELGGISHIDYGMTTTGVHEFTIQLLKAMGLKETEVTKLQTGGPDGDLGSNEILISHDKTTAIVDGAGVVYDPAGIDRSELTRLALLRQDLSKFDKTKLSASGFLVLISDQNVTLPSGEKVKYGESFRNQFHLHPLSQSILFVPCGGRPRSINMNNVGQLLIDGKPKHQLIVEGANLFLTQEAREFLEAKGVKIIKDSSANKGGVTSSAYEVLAGLALNDEEFTRLMVAKQTHDIRGFRSQNIDQLVTDSMNDDSFSLERLSAIAGHIGEVPEFRKKYIGDIIQIIKDNAILEFKALWTEHKKTSESLSTLSDKLSNKINVISSQLESSELFENMELRRTVLQSYMPPSLVAEIGMDKLMERIPLNYQKAIFCKQIARMFVYTKGIEATPEDYRVYIQNIKN